MNTTIYYFSGTGNSIHIAKKIAAGFEKCELVPISRALKAGNAVKGERVGIVFPVYMYRPPKAVVKFIKKIESAQYFFAVANNGGNVGKALSQVKKILRRKGLELNAGFGVLMPGNYAPLYDPPPQDIQDEIFDEAQNKIKLIIETASNNARYMDKEASFGSVYFWPGIFYWFGYVFIPLHDLFFSVDSTCDKCGLCARVCPANNISLVEGKPKWNHRCEECLACLQWCPQEAIQFKKSTKGRKRYHHPDVSLKDLLQK